MRWKKEMTTWRKDCSLRDLERMGRSLKKISMEGKGGDLRKESMRHKSTFDMWDF